MCALFFVFFIALPNPALGHISLNDPNGGEVLEVGSQFTVTWQIEISHTLLNWDVWYSTTGPGGPWIVIAENLPPGSSVVGSIHTYDWTIPDTPSTQVRIRVRMDNSGQDYESISNADLTIAAVVPVPTLSVWGMIVITLMLCTAGTIILRRSNVSTSAPNR